VTERKMLKRILDVREKETGGWRKLHNIKEPHDLYSSPNIIRTIGSRGMRRAEMSHAWRYEEYVQNYSQETEGKKNTWETKS
jgi:hypothetical protein